MEGGAHTRCKWRRCVADKGSEQGRKALEEEGTDRAVRSGAMCCEMELFATAVSSAKP